MGRLLGDAGGSPGCDELQPARRKLGAGSLDARERRVVWQPVRIQTGGEW